MESEHEVEAAEMAEQEEGEAMMESAFAAAGLAVPPVECQWVLGHSEWEKFCVATLAQAGIQIEMAQRAEGFDGTEDFFLAVQIVSERDFEGRMTNQDHDAISLIPSKYCLGLSVKLGNQFAWKVSIDEKLPERTFRGIRKRTGRAGAAVGTVTIHNQHTHEIVVLDEIVGSLKTTVALGQTITINLLYELGADGSVVMGADGFPTIAQRRVDMTFLNKHLTTGQVCSVL